MRYLFDEKYCFNRNAGFGQKHSRRYPCKDSWYWLCTDLVIQQRENALLQDIINEKGLQCFLDKERDAILSLECENCVVATGGSVVFRDEAMQKLKRNSVIVFIDVPLKNVKARLKNIKTRGVAAPKNQTIDDIFFERLPLYKKYADITVDTADLSPEETVSRIIFSLKN